MEPLSQSINGILGITAKSVVNDLERILLDLSGIYWVPWDGTNSSGTPVSGGVYFVRMTAENFVDVKKMALIK